MWKGGEGEKFSFYNKFMCHLFQSLFINVHWREFPGFHHFRTSSPYFYLDYACVFKLKITCADYIIKDCLNFLYGKKFPSRELYSVVQQKQEGISSA